jgi:pilus assembly protein Flp/PilA
MLTSFEYLAGWMRAKFGEDERGASLVEYALLLALIAVVCIIAVTALGQNASTKLDSVADSVN